MGRKRNHTDDLALSVGGKSTEADSKIVTPNSNVGKQIQIVQ